MNGLPHSVVLVGAGNMGGALLRGWLDQGLPAAAITVVEPRPSDQLAALAQHRGFALTGAPDAAVPEVLVLAIKPQMLDAVAPSLAGLSRQDALVVSIMAGRTIASIAAVLPARAIIRAMPNTPAAVRRGITGVFASDAVDAAQRVKAEALLGCVGPVEWLERESLIDAVTAVSGSGPAYVFLLVECLAEAARGAGLAPEQAERFARATVVGAGALMEAEPGIAAAQLRRNVTSPGGTTAAALDVLDGHGALRTLLTRAVAAARDRAVELAG